MMLITPVAQKQEKHHLLHCDSSTVPFQIYKSQSHGTQGDRFIPTRSAINFEVANFTLTRQVEESSLSTLSVASPPKEEYKKKLAEALLHDSSGKRAKILAFKRKPKTSSGFGQHFLLDELFSDECSAVQKYYRHVPQSAERILDAPDMVDDYYLNLLDWSCNDVVAIALGSTAYLWDAESGKIEQIMQANNEGDYLTSIAWAEDGKHISIGLNSSEVQLWDTMRMCRVRKMGGHSSRVGSLAWNGQILSSGSRDSLIINHDVRVRDHIVLKLRGHSQEVCGLKWSRAGKQLASGGNDNILHIWDASSMSSSAGSKYLYRFDQHQAAVKALAWCPFQANVLASGGGTADRSIKLWNIQTGLCISSLDTRSQVCALQWNRHQKEILSSHGYSQNQLCLWKYPSMVKVAELNGHTARVLHLAQSPDGTTVVSAAADETLRFWKVFGNPNMNSSNTRRGGGTTLSLQRNNIR